MGGNRDKKITSDDAVWPNLRLWLDENADGLSTVDEIIRLDGSDITEIDLKSKYSPKHDEAGNALTWWSWGNGGIFVTKDGGQSWTMDERAPLQDNAHSICFDPMNNTKVIYGYSGGGMLYGDRL